MPAAHGEHVDSEEAPLSPEYVPAGHRLQTTAPAGENVPAGHVAGGKLVYEHSCPAGHGVHVDEEEALDTSEYVPAAHGVHVEEEVAPSVVEYVPKLHCLQKSG